VSRFGSRSRARRAAAGLATAVVAVAALATTAAPVGASVADRPRSATPGFVFNDGRYRRFEALSPRVEIFPSGINDGGYVTGEYMRPDRESGFVRDSRGGISTFDVPGARAIEAVKLNDRRQIVGRYSEDTPFVDDSARVRGYIPPGSRPPDRTPAGALRDELLRHLPDARRQVLTANRPPGHLDARARPRHRLQLRRAAHPLPLEPVLPMACGQRGRLRALQPSQRGVALVDDRFVISVCERTIRRTAP
jgi:hypothetical protein